MGSSGITGKETSGGGSNGFGAFGALFNATRLLKFFKIAFLLKSSRVLLTILVLGLLSDLP
jgi:hypothetical protein